jgi:hypothetical protein
MSENEPYWAPTCYVRRSRLDGRVWVPQPEIDVDDVMALHPGPLSAVRPWAEQYARDRGVRYDCPVEDLRWTKLDKDTWLLETLGG